MLSSVVEYRQNKSHVVRARNTRTVVEEINNIEDFDKIKTTNYIKKNEIVAILLPSKNNA